MAKGVGQTILDAAQQVVAQFTQQNQLQLQQLAMEQSFAVQSQLMDLRSQQATAQEKLNAIKMESEQLQLQTERQKQELFAARGGVAGEVARLETSESLKIREAEAKIAITDQTGVAGLKASERIDRRAKVIALANEMHEKKALANMASSRPEYHPFALLSMDDLRETQREINRVATRGGSITDLLQTALIQGNESLRSKLQEAEKTGGMTLGQLQSSLTSYIQEAAGAVATGPDEKTLQESAIRSGVLPEDLNILFPGGYTENPGRSAAVKLFGPAPFNSTHGFYTQIQAAVQEGRYAEFLGAMLDTGAIPARGAIPPDKQSALKNYLLEATGGDQQRAADFLRKVLTQRAKEQ